MPTIQQLEKEIQRLKSAVEELTVLNDLAVAASSSMEVDQMLNIIVNKSIKAVKAEQGSISLVTEQQEKPFRTLIRQVDRSKQPLAYRLSDHITGWVLKNRKPLIIGDLSKDNRFLVSEEERKKIRSVLCVPIWSKAKIIGILLMINKKTNNPFDSNDLRLLSIIAAQSGQLILNSQLQEEALEKKRLEQELALARDIQMRLLPIKEPVNAGLEISSFFNPASQVGGDYYDYFDLGNQKIGIVIADVSGHGASSALIMTMVKGILHSIARKFISSNQVLSELNSIIAEILPKGMFITMMFLVFDVEKKILRFSNAGHNPLLFYNNQTKTCQTVELKGCALNLLKNPAYSVKEISLRPSDLIFIYTDGVTEAVNEKKEMFGETRLTKTIEETADKSADEIINYIKTKLDSFTGKTPQADDTLMIAVKMN